MQTRGLLLNQDWDPHRDLTLYNILPSGRQMHRYSAVHTSQNLDAAHKSEPCHSTREATEDGSLATLAWNSAMCPVRKWFGVSGLRQSGVSPWDVRGSAFTQASVSHNTVSSSFRVNSAF